MKNQTAPVQSLRLLICLSLAVMVVIIYGQTRHFGFINYDDPTYVTENAYVQKGITAASVKWAFTTGHGSNWHPITWLSHMLDWQLAGDRPGIHHLVNCLIHCLNAILLFLVIGQATGAIWRAAFVAALFAVHPLQVESVAWIAQRKNLLCALFWLLALWAYGRFVARPCIRRYMLLALFFALGLMTKPMLVTLPLVLLVLDYWPLRRLQAGFGHLLAEKAPLFVLAAASAFTTYLVQKAGGAVVPLQTLPLVYRWYNAALSYVSYLWHMLWPFKLAVFYPYSVGTFKPGIVLGAWLILIGVTGMAVVRRKQYPYVMAGWLWYLVTLVPVIGLIQVGEQARADRYVYIPSMGIFAALVWLLADIGGRNARARLQKNRLDRPELGRAGAENIRILAPLAAGAVVLALAVSAYVQTGYWKDSITLFSHALSVTAGNAVAYNNLGLALAREGRIAEAKEQFQKALEVSPDDPEANYNLGLILARQRRYRQAINHYRISLKNRPNSPEVFDSLGNALAALGSFDEAIDCYRKALALDPSNFRAHNNLANELFRKGKIEEAISEYRQAIVIKPEFAEAHKNLALVLFHKGDYAGAWSEASLARKYGAELNPGFLHALSWKMAEPVTE